MQIDSQVKCIDNEERHSWRTLFDGLTLSVIEDGANGAERVKPNALVPNTCGHEGQADVEHHKNKCREGFWRYEDEFAGTKPGWVQTKQKNKKTEPTFNRVECWVRCLQPVGNLSEQWQTATSDCEHLFEAPKCDTSP